MKNTSSLVYNLVAVVPNFSDLCKAKVLEPGDLLEVPHWNDITSARWVGPREDWKFEPVLATVLDSGWGYDPRITIAFPDGTAKQLQTSIFRRMVETGKAKIVVKNKEAS